MIEKGRDQEPAKPTEALTSLSSSHEGGLVLIDKKYEPLKEAIRAYKSRLAAQLDLPEKLKQYHNAREEKAKLSVNHQRILETQTMFEGPMLALPKRPIKLNPSLETILEVSSRRENARTESHRETKHHSHKSREAIFLEELPKADK